MSFCSPPSILGYLEPIVSALASRRCQMQELHTVAYGIEARGEEKRCMGAKETDSLALPSSPPFYSPQKNYIKPNKLFPPRDV